MLTFPVQWIAEESTQPSGPESAEDVVPEKSIAGHCRYVSVTTVFPLGPTIVTLGS